MCVHIFFVLYWLSSLRKIGVVSCYLQFSGKQYKRAYFQSIWTCHLLEISWKLVLFILKTSIVNRCFRTTEVFCGCAKLKLCIFYFLISSVQNFSCFLTSPYKPWPQQRSPLSLVWLSRGSLSLIPCSHVFLLWLSWSSPDFHGPCLLSLLDLLNSFSNFLQWKILKLKFLLFTLYKIRRPLLPGLLVVYFHYLSILITFKIFLLFFSWMNYLSYQNLIYACTRGIAVNW